MNLEHASIRAFELRLHAPLATAHGAIAARRGWLVRIEDGDGIVGIGEATPLPQFGTERLDACEKMLQRTLEEWVAVDAASDSAPNLLADVQGKARLATPAACAALECALSDILAQRGGLALSAYWRQASGHAGAPADAIRVQALVGGVTPEAVQSSAQRAMHLGHRAYKLKLAVSPGVLDIAPDVERVAALREVVGSDATIRLDANEAWTLEIARRALEALAHFEIDYVEQPVARHDIGALSALDRDGAIAVAADEALLGNGLERCLEAEAVRIFVVKPAAMGGFSAANSLFREAEKRGLRVVWSSLLDGAVGRRAALHVAAALGPEKEIHGLGTGALLATDFERDPPIEAGAVRLVRGSGLGMATSLGDRRTFDSPSGPWIEAKAHFGGPP